MATYQLAISAVRLPAALGAALGYRVIDHAGDELIARTTAGITEPVAGEYHALVTLDTAWAGGVIVWDDGDREWSSGWTRPIGLARDGSDLAKATDVGGVGDELTFTDEETTLGC